MEGHDAEVGDVLGDNVATIDLALSTELLQALEVACTGGLRTVFDLEGNQPAFHGGDDIHLLIFAAPPVGETNALPVVAGEDMVEEGGFNRDAEGGGIFEEGPPGVLELERSRVETFPKLMFKASVYD